MKLSRRWSWFLVAFGVWSWIIWPTFIKNIAGDKRSFTGNTPHAFFIVHLLLTVVSLALGTAVGVLGIRGLRGLRGRGGIGERKEAASVEQTSAPAGSDHAGSHA